MSPLRTRAVLCVSLAILCSYFVTAVFAQDAKPVTQQPQPNNAALPAAKVPTIKNFEHYASYWTSEPGWDTELRLKNNLPSTSLTVTPVLRLPSGEETSLTPMTIPPNTSVSVSVNEALREHAPSLFAQSGSYGAILLRFSSFNAMNLYATAVPSLQGLPVAFNVRAHPGWDPTDALRNNGPGSLEGMWWRARSGLNDILVISNSSNETIVGTLLLFDAAGKQWSQPVSLGPHQIERMATMDLVQKAGLSGNYGGISFVVPAAASAIDGVHFMYDQGGKFTAALEMFPRNPSSTVLQRTGIDQTQWTLRAPMLALSEPDPALGLPLTTLLRPTVLVRNTTSKKVSANISLAWRGDSVGKGQVNLPELQLAPFATQQLEIWAMQKQLGIPQDAHWALVSLTTNAAPDDVIAIASSRDCTGVYDIETKFVGGRGGNFAGGEWRTDATHNQLAAVTNVGTQPTDALLTLHYNNGVDKYELQQTIAPGDQMWVNLAQLVRQGLSDRNGKLLPPATNSVTYDLQDLTAGSHALMANDLAVNTAAGQAIPNCPWCCGGYDSEYFSPDPLEVVLFGSASMGVLGVNGCNNTPYWITKDFSVWSSSNSNIAEVTYAEAQGVSVGQVIGTAEGRVPVPGECACNFMLETVTEPVNVTPPITVTMKFTGNKSSGDNLSFLKSGTDCSETLGANDCTSTTGYWVWNLEGTGVVNDDASQWTVAVTANWHYSGQYRDSNNNLHPFSCSVGNTPDGPQPDYLQQPSGQKTIFFIDGPGPFHGTNPSNQCQFGSSPVDSMTDVIDFQVTFTSKVSSFVSTTKYFVKIVVAPGGKLDFTNTIAGMGNI